VSGWGGRQEGPLRIRTAMENGGKARGGWTYPRPMEPDLGRGQGDVFGLHCGAAQDAAPPRDLADFVAARTSAVWAAIRFVRWP